MSKTRKLASRHGWCRFSNRGWSEWPLTADRYADWLAGSGGDSVHLFMDFETFGEHQWDDTGTFEFLHDLPRQLAHRGLTFGTASEVVDGDPVGVLSIPQQTSWADLERDVSAWLGNEIQTAAHDRLYRLLPAIHESHDPELIEDWRRLSTSDHFYYICTKWFTDGDVHKYFSPYDSPYDAYITYMNVLQDLESRIKRTKRFEVTPVREAVAVQ